MFIRFIQYIFTKKNTVYFFPYVIILLLLNYCWDLGFTNDMNSFIAFCFAGIMGQIQSINIDKDGK